MEKNSIIFSEDKTSFHFIFAGGKESDNFQSKKAGFEALVDLANQERISYEEFVEMRDQIFKTDELAWSEPKKHSISVEVISMPGMFGGFGFPGFGGGLLESFMALESLSRMLHSPDEPVEVAYFKMCECGGNHGRIYFKAGYTGTIGSKKHAINYLNELKEKKLITDEEITKMKTEIEGSKLPAE